MNDKTQIEIKRFDFSSIDDKTLGWICIEPTIQKIQGKDLTIKSQVYAQLTSGQKSLLLFWILYGHASNGIIQLFEEIEYLFSETGIWIEFNKQFKRFGDYSLLNLINEIENLYDDYIQEKKSISLGFQLKIDSFNIKYNEIIFNILKHIGKYIRDNSNEFVYFTD
jgi:hypothetical protein